MRVNQPQDYANLIEKAWSGQLDFFVLFEVAAGLESRGQTVLAVVLYQTWLQRTLSPYMHAVHFNLGVALGNLGDDAGAEAAYRRALALQETFVQPRLNLGTLCEKRGDVDGALAHWSWIEHHIPATEPQTRPMVIMALNNQARVRESRKELSEASRLLTQSLTLDPNQPDALHHWVHLRQKQCIWPVYLPFEGVTREAMQRSTSALAMLNISDDPQMQLDAARHYVAQKLTPPPERLSPQGSYSHRKLRIGYASSDFCLHPVSMLMVELFERHDRSRVEVFGYCWSPEDGSALRQRVIASMDQFHRIGSLDDAAAARLIRMHEIDVLIDLQGQTAGARANMLAYRPAPVQITYLGLPATTGLPSIDYVIADRFLIPPETAQFYSEKPLYMPDVYQVSDRHRAVGGPATRAACGLPEGALVFCCHNNNFKITPEIFAAWTRIVQRVPDSVLWLLADNPWAEEQLRAQWLRSGQVKERLIFASRALPPDYLARFACADLFLDTFPFNAGTTANDALWMGLPVLTLCGKTFAARMAGALLTAAGLPELITNTLADYEDRACELATRPELLLDLRERLLAQRTIGPLFDTALFAKNLETKLLAITDEGRYSTPRQ